MWTVYIKLDMTFVMNSKSIKWGMSLLIKDL